MRGPKKQRILPVYPRATGAFEKQPNKSFDQSFRQPQTHSQYRLGRNLFSSR